MSAIGAERCIGGNDLTEPRLSPDGRLLVYARSTAGVASLVVHHCESGRAQQLATSPPLRAGRGLGGGAWAWFPDGSAIGAVLVAPAHPSGGCQGRGLGDADEFEGEVAVGLL